MPQGETRRHPHALRARTVPRASPLLAAAGLAVPLLAGCQAGAWNPAGEGAQKIAFLGWFMLAVGGAIALGVLGLLLAALLRRRPAPEGEGQAPRPLSRRLVLWGGIALPVVVILVLMSLTVNTLVGVSGAASSGVPTVEVTAQMWWWNMRYPEQGFGLGNEMHIPVGQRVPIRLTSADVIHSFWVPALHGKRDANPGLVSPFWLEASQPGVYRGECAEFCGLQHAKMQFLVVAQPADEFAAWLAQMAEPAPEPATDLTRRGQEVFLRSGCAGCHTLRGTSAAGTTGPELTHLASKLELGAGVLENTPGHLGGWVADAQHFKPGIVMPSLPLPSEDLHALLAYLETLR